MYMPKLDAICITPIQTYPVRPAEHELWDEVRAFLRQLEGNVTSSLSQISALQTQVSALQTRVVELEKVPVPLNPIEELLLLKDKCIQDLEKRLAKYELSEKT